MTQNKKSALIFGALAVVAAAALMITAIGVGGVDAAKGGQSAGCRGGPKHCGGGTTSTATLSVSPNPVPYGSTSFAFSGSGFGANQTIVIGVSGMCCLQEITTGSTGAFAVDFPFWAGYAGVCYGAGAWNRDLTTLLASTSFCVTSP